MSQLVTLSSSEMQPMPSGAAIPGVLVERKRVLLIEPPFYRLYHDNFSLIKYPLALGYLSGAVRQWTDWHCETYNADFCTRRNISVSGSYLIGDGFQRYLKTLKDPPAPIWDEVREAIRDVNPGVVGISSKTQNFTSAACVARIVKELDPAIQVVLGGPHATMSPQHALACPDIDVVAVGEGEMTLVELLKAYDAGESLSQVRGLWLRNGAGNVQTGARPYIDDLEVLPNPIQYAPEVLRDYDKYPLEAFGHIFSARGCPYACTFCESKSIWTQKTRWRSPRHIVEEIKQLQALGLNDIMFDDDTFGIKQSYIEELCGLIENECPGLSWTCEMTVGITRDKSLKAMKRAGCVAVMMGIESGNNDMLKTIKKAQTIEKAYQAVDTVKANDVEVHTFFMIGFPHETEATLADTVAAIKKINADSVILSIFTSYPGSEMFEVCRALGLVDDDFDVTVHNHQSPENCFTAYIDPERFRVLAKRVTRIVDRKNTLNKVRRVGFVIRTRGVRHTVRHTARILMGQVRARVMPALSNAFFKQDRVSADS